MASLKKTHGKKLLYHSSAIAERYPFGSFYDHFKVTQKGDHRCKPCGCSMEFICKISEIEALRWVQYMKGPQWTSMAISMIWADQI